MNKSDIQTLQDLFTYATGSSRYDVFQFREGNGITHIPQEQFRSDVLHIGAVIASIAQSKSRIALIGDNSYLYLVCYFGIVVSGNLPVMLDKALDIDTLAGIVQNSKTSVVLCSEDYRENAKAVCPDVYCFDELPAMQDGISLDAPVKAESEAICSIFHTSSSTGSPKLVPLTHRNLISSVKAIDGRIPVSGVTLLCLPLHHVFGMITNILCPLYKSVTVFLNDSVRRLIADIRLVQPSVLICVPMMYMALLHALSSHQTPEALRALVGPNMTYFCIGGAACTIDPTLLIKAGITPSIGYGLTETSSSITQYPITSEIFDADNVGKPLESVQIRIGNRNEILIKGDMVFNGYLANDEANRSSFTDGYFRTGDMGYMDDTGNLHITGRIKNLIILPNGENVPAEKLESLLYKLPYVTECVIKEYEGKITAFIYSEVPDDAAANIEKDLKTVNRELPLNHNITKYIFRTEPFPKTTSQKIKHI